MSTRLGKAKSARSNRTADVERVERFLELLLDRIVGAFLEHIHLAVVGGIGARVGVGGFDLLIEFTSLDDDEERLLERDGQLIRSLFRFHNSRSLAVVSRRRRKTDIGKPRLRDKRGFGDVFLVK